MTLYEMKAEYMEILSMLEAPDADEEIIRDTLESLQGDIEDKAEGYGMVIAQLNAEAEMLMVESVRLSKRAKTALNNADRLKRRLQAALTEMQLKKLKTNHFNFTVRKNAASVVILPDTEIPDEYLVQQEPKVDKAKVKADLQAGKDLPFAKLESTESLIVR